MTTAGDQSKPVKGALLAMVLLTALNFVNYIDRYILPGVQEMVKAEFRLTDAQIGSLTTWFFVAYILAAPLTGWLGDCYSRKWLIVIGVTLWSATNFFTASVHEYGALLTRHAALGIGEASFGIFAPSLLSDFYPASQRNRVMTIFNVAVPVGAALGYTLGGLLAETHGWRAPFIVSAIPGIAIAAVMIFIMREPKQGSAEKTRGKVKKADAFGLMKNRAYLFAVLGYAMVTFMIGGVSAWIPSFLQRFQGMTQAKADYSVGLITVVCGLTGTIAGGALAQFWLKKSERALYYVCALGALLAIPFSLLCFFGPHAMVLPALALAEVAIFLGNGPVNAAVVNSVPAGIRATALAGQLFLLHALGDVPSPKVIGLVSDVTNLRAGLSVTLLALVAATAFFMLGSRYAEPDAS